MTILGFVSCCLVIQGSTAHQSSQPPSFAVAMCSPLKPSDGEKFSKATSEESLVKAAASMGAKAVRIENNLWLLYDEALVTQGEASLAVLQDLVKKASGSSPVRVSDLDQEAKSYVLGMLRDIGTYANADDETLQSVPIHLAPSIEASVDFPQKREVFFLNERTPFALASQLSSMAPKVDRNTPVNSASRGASPGASPSSAWVNQIHLTFGGRTMRSSSSAELGSLAMNALAALRKEFLASRDRSLRGVYDEMLRTRGGDDYTSGRAYRAFRDLPNDAQAKIKSEIDSSWQVLGWESPQAAAKDYSQAKLFGLKSSLVLEIGLPSSPDRPYLYVKPLGALPNKG